MGYSGFVCPFCFLDISEVDKKTFTFKTLTRINHTKLLSEKLHVSVGEKSKHSSGQCVLLQSFTPSLPSCHRASIDISGEELSLRHAVQIWQSWLFFFNFLLLLVSAHLIVNVIKWMFYNAMLWLYCRKKCRKISCCSSCCKTYLLKSPLKWLKCECLLLFFWTWMSRAELRC